MKHLTSPRLTEGRSLWPLWIKKIVFPLLAFFLFFSTISAQAQLCEVESFSSEILEGRQISGITNDADGFVWMTDGLEVFRFNGRNFETPITWYLPFLLPTQENYISGIHHYGNGCLFLQAQDRVMLFDLYEERFDALELKDSAGVAYECISFQFIGEEDILLHCVKEQTAALSTSEENVLPDDKQMVFLRLKDRQLKTLSFSQALLYNNHYQRLRLPWLTIDANGHQYLFYNKRLTIKDEQGKLLESFDLNTLCRNEDCKVLTQFDVHQNLVFSYGGKFYQVRDLDKPPSLCGKTDNALLTPGKKKGLFEHCINTVIEQKFTYFSANPFVLNDRGDIWFYGQNQKFIYFNQQKGEIQELTESYGDFGIYSNVFCKGKGEMLWVGGEGKVSVLTPEKRYYQFTGCAIPPNLASKTFKAIQEDEDGKIYGLIPNHIFKFDPQTKQSDLLTTGVGVQRDMMYTSQGIWLSNGDFYDFAKDSTVNVQGSHPRTDLTNGLYEEFSEGHSTFQYNRDSTVISGVGPALYRALKENFTELLATNKSGDLWRANDSMIYQLVQVEGVPQWKAIKKLNREDTGSGWLTTFHYGEKSGLFWLAFNSGYLLAFDSSSGQVRTVDLQIAQNDLYLQDVKELDQEHLWIATSTALLKYSTKEATIVARYGREHGLITEDNGHILLQGDSCVWLETRDGLIRFDVEQEVFDSYTQKDGLTYRMENALLGSNGDFYFTINHSGSKNGLVNFDPKDLMDKVQQQRGDVRIVLSSMEYADEQQGDIIQHYFFQNQKQVDLYHWNKALRLEFAMTGGGNPGSTRYSYRLHGNHDVWDLPSKVNFARFVSLPSGKYDFEVRAQNEYGVWYPHQLSIPIIVHPPWWRTTFAYLIYSLLLGGLLLLLYNVIKKRLTLQSQLYQEQQEALRLKELDSFKSKLYTNLTHEFRTPLTVIIGLVRKVREEPQKFLEEGTHIIERNSKSLLRIINQLLDLSKLEDRSFKLQLQQEEIISYLNYITESFHSYANGKNLSLRFYASDESLVMDYDPEQIQQVMTNLISNAIKFTSSGGEVFVRVVKNQDRLDIEVNDTGRGIPSDKIEMIFDRFYQVDNTETREGEGTGIGLSHTKELIKLMGGKISVKSKLGKGSQFVVSLPIRRNAPIATETSILSTPIELVPKTQVVLEENRPENLPHLLIIEDNPDVVLYLKSCLETHYHLDVAYNGTIGIEKAIETIPDLIVSDVMMPGKDGFEVCNTLKTDQRTSHIPIILLTAKADISSKLQGLERGADAYLAKPFHQQELLIRLKKLAELRKRMSEFFARQLAATSDLKPVVEEVTKDKALQIENDFIQKINTILETHIADEYFGLPDLCQKVRMSRSQLFRKLKALTGTPPSTYIRKYRLQKSRFLLETTDKNVAEASFAVGFKDPSYFTKLFKEEFGILPGAVIKKNG